MPLSLAATRTINGFVRASLINSRYGLDLLTEVDNSDDDGFNLDLETAEMAQFYCNRQKAREELGYQTGALEMIIREGDRYHLMRMVDGVPDVLVHVVIERHSANLLNARSLLATITSDVGRELLH
jgi:hypothetical protein